MANISTYGRFMRVYRVVCTIESLVRVIFPSCRSNRILRLLAVVANRPGKYFRIIQMT